MLAVATSSQTGTNTLDARVTPAALPPHNQPNRTNTPRSARPPAMTIITCTSIPPYLVVYPPLISIVWPVIHHPSDTRKRTNGTISRVSVNPVLENGDKAAAVLW